MKIYKINTSSSRITLSEFVEETKYVYSPDDVTRGFDNWDWKLLRAWDLGYQAIEAVGQRNIALHKVQAERLSTSLPPPTDTPSKLANAITS